MINKPKVLIIDDNKDNIAILKVLLYKEYEEAIVVSSLSGDLGIELAKSVIPDLILLDILMPGKDGFQTCTELKSHVDLQSIPVVFVTALKEDKNNKIKALNVGADGFLTKPIDETSLKTIVKAMLKVREAELLKENEKERLRLLIKEKTHKLEKELKEKAIIESNLRNSEARYIGLVNNLDSGVVIHDAEMNIIESNQKGAEILGVSLTKIIGKSVRDKCQFVDKAEKPLLLSDFPVQIIKRSLAPLKDYIIGIKKSKEIVWVTVNGHPRLLPDGSLKEIVISFSDISEQVEYEKQLIYSANNDHLTGLFNRRYYENLLTQYNDSDISPLTIAMADINGLKLINDAFGHIYGDQMLKHAADVILEAVDDSDTVCRIGGDEFGIIMPFTSSIQASEKVKKIHELSKNILIQSIELSISVGYESRLNQSEDLFDISRSAEDVMYRQKLIEIPSMRSNAIETILSTLYEKDRYSEYHSRKVSKLAANLGHSFGLEPQMIKEIETAGLVHDIGKIIIPSAIINKVGRLTKEERDVINTHPEIGFRILNSSSQLRSVSAIVLNHHERYDGSGYPRNILGDNIPIQSRIISIADSFEAMTSVRPYRGKMTNEVAKQEIIDNAGSQFDPKLVQVFIDNFDQIIKDL